MPSIGIDQTMEIRSGSRTVQISWLGKAHTDGDLSIFVPDAKVIITSDSLHAGTPTFTDAAPYDWIRTLDAAEKLDFDTVIGGHGEVMHGKETFELWKRYFTELLSVTADAVAKGQTLAEAQAALRPGLIEKYGSKFGEIPTPFAQTVDANIERAFRSIAGPFAP